MFEVCCYSPLDEDWEDRIKEMTRVVGWQGQSMYTATSSGVREIDTTWLVKTLGEAQEIKVRLETIGKVRISIREAITY